MILTGAIIGAIFFAAFYGLDIVNPEYTDWIFQPITHDTAQHFIGWEFFRADSTGGIINGLAYPIGLPVTFMDAIPLVAFPFKWLAAILPETFQYFGMWAMSCYVLMGALAAVLMRKIWQSFDNLKKLNSNWRILFVAAGSLMFVLSPMMIARTLYHSALAAHWLILLGILLVWDSRVFKKWWKFMSVWSVVLVLAVLIHPYFLPMMGAMMLIAALKDCEKFNFLIVGKLLVQTMIPVVIVGVVFAMIGGFRLGGGAEFSDLGEKGFNLLSFAISGGYSVIPSLPQKSSSPETLMWLGLGVWTLIIGCMVIGRKRIKNVLIRSINVLKKAKLRNGLIAIVIFGLLIFSIGTSIDFGPFTLFSYSVPDKIYEIWSAFRAAAREAWMFYYVAILLVIYAVTKLFTTKYGKRAPQIIALVLLTASIIQFGDIWFSGKATTRREGFSQIQNVSGSAYKKVEISDFVTSQKHLVMLDKSFRGDISGTYEIAQAASENNLTLNIGFFARIPDEVWTQQSDWRNKVANNNLSNDSLKDYIFATKDIKLAKSASQKYLVTLRDGYYFIRVR